MGQNHPRRRLPTAATIDQWNLEKSMAFYKDRFADASDFTFVFVGNFDLAAMKPLVERYLGSLPSLRRKETWKDVEASGRRRASIDEDRWRRASSRRARRRSLFTGPFEYDQTQRVAIRAHDGDARRRACSRRIREDLGGTYSISASPSYARFPIPTYTISIAFGSDPKRLDDLVARVFQEIEQLKAAGPTQKQVTDERGAAARFRDQHQAERLSAGADLVRVSEQRGPGQPVARAGATTRSSTPRRSSRRRGRISTGQPRAGHADA